MSNRPNKPETGETSEFDADLNDTLKAFGESLKKLFDHTLQEPIPDSFLELLDRLDDEWEVPEE